MPSHVVQRGIDRNPCFFEEDNYWFLLDCLSDACERYFVQAWTLEMPMMCEKQWRFLHRSETIFLKNGLRKH
jgi:hypothetical protein